MPLANFFSKNSLAAHQILNGIAPTQLAGILEAQVVAVGIDDAAADSLEGRATASLAVDLAARLYPRLALLPLGRCSAPLTELMAELAARARAIHPEIEIDTTARDVTMAVVVGDTEAPVALRARSLVVYAGSHDWAAGLSLAGPVGSGPTANPLGAGAAACFALANVFRAVFAAQLPAGRLDDPFALSLFDYARLAHLRSGGGVEGPAFGAGIGAAPIALGETVLAGVGAIANGTVWALGRMPSLRGALHLVDPEAISLTNLQRYVLATQSDVTAEVCKVDLAARTLTGRGSALRIVPHAVRWGRFLSDRNDWRLERVLTAFDTVDDRLAVQAGLPWVLLNAWTQVGDLGVSRHLAFGEHPCLACLYRPVPGGKSEAELVGEAMGLPGAPFEIRELLYSGSSIDEAFIRGVAARRGITEPDAIATLVEFRGRSLRQFYNEVFCGGVILELGGGNNGGTVRAEAPMAFQSALAGIMLAAALVVDASRARPADGVPVRTMIDLLRPLAPYLEPPISRREDGRCICQDADYLEAYAAKYSATAP